MHELFLTASVPGNDVLAARSVLQGYCAMPEVHQLTRVLHYTGPDRPSGFKKVGDLDGTPNRRLFNDLHQYLTKQSYIMTVRYQLNEDEFGQEVGGSSSLDQRQGTLRWTDIPDPVPPQVLHVQRKMLDIRNQDRLITILGQNAHTIKAECIEESYTWCRDSVEYTLERMYIYPGEDPLVPIRQTEPRTFLPAFSDLRPLSSNWMLRAKAFVSEPTPERMAQAAGALAAARADLLGVFNFRQFDRRVHDTRVAAPSAASTMPRPLPQVVTVDRA